MSEINRQMLESTERTQDTDFPLVRAGGVALPLTSDPWEALARGVRFPRQEVTARLAALQESGCLLGVMGEPNPVVRRVREFLLSTEEEPGWRYGEEGFLRWKGRTPDGRWLASSLLAREHEPPAEAAPSAAFQKAGLPLLPLVTVDEMLHPTQDRTYLARQEDALPPAPEGSMEALFRAFSVPGAVPFGRNFWEWVAEVAGVDAGTAGTGVRQLIMQRNWRRFSLRWNMHRAGWAGAGVACWRFEKEEDLGQAAAALAAVAGTGDVAIRGGGGGSFGNLTALFLSRSPQAAEQTARGIAAQWKRDLVRWEPLELN